MSQKVYLPGFIFTIRSLVKTLFKTNSNTKKPLQEQYRIAPVTPSEEWVYCCIFNFR